MDSVNDTEHTIIYALLTDQKFIAKTISKILDDHFNDPHSREVFHVIKDHYFKYSQPPSLDELNTILYTGQHEPEFMENVTGYLQPLEDISTEFVFDLAEKYCRERSIMLALFESIDIAEGNNSKISPSVIPEIMSEAINFAFVHDLGLNYYKDIDRRVDYYFNESTKIPFKTAMLNKVTNGGVEGKTLNVFTAPTGFGKSIFMADEALFQSARGLNVLYYTFEMSDDRISDRMNANYLDIRVNDLIKFRENLKKKFHEQQSKAKGLLILKEYSPGCTTARQLADHIKLVEMQENLKIDIVYIDYINLMKSAAPTTGKYDEIRIICEEIIALISKGYNIPVISATQVNRSGQANTDVSIVNIADSQGLSNTVDFLAVFYDNEELSKINRAVCKQLKNRYGDMNYYKTFIVGIERAKMRFFDIDEHESDKLVENVNDNKDKTEAPGFENTNFFNRGTTNMSGLNF